MRDFLQLHDLCLRQRTRSIMGLERHGFRRMDSMSAALILWQCLVIFSHPALIHASCLTLILAQLSWTIWRLLYS